MHIEIDQSNKIENTGKDTIIGLSTNCKLCTILIPRHIKRKLQEEFRHQGKPRLFIYRTFIAGVVLLLAYSSIKLSKNDIIQIDIEYSGKELMLTSMFLEMFSRLFSFTPQIQFKNIGKKSLAHQISYMTSTNRKKPNRIITYGEIGRLALK